jgi:hypothetical protein
MADGGAARGARILYITGSGRSGTNFLGQLLGQADRFCFVGEAMYGGPSLATRRCGCGVPLPGCEFWRGIRRDAGDGRLLDEQRFFGLGRLARWRHLPLTLAPDRARRLAALYGQDWQGCATLYATIAAATGAEVIVDTSKSVPYARMLSLVPELDVPSCTWSATRVRSPTRGAASSSRPTATTMPT